MEKTAEHVDVDLLRSLAMLSASQPSVLFDAYLQGLTVQGARTSTKRG